MHRKIGSHHYEDFIMLSQLITICFTIPQLVLLNIP